MRGRPLEFDDRIAELTRAGWTLAAIAAELGITERTVSRGRARRGLSAPVPARWTAEELSIAERLLDEGASVAEAARTVGRSPQVLYNRYPDRVWSHQEAGRWAHYCERMKRKGISI